MQYSEQRASGRVVHVEVAPGIVTVLPDWMLDASICAGMILGAPRVSTDALSELHRLLVVRGFRRSSSDCLVTQENRDDRVALDGVEHIALSGAAAADNMTFESQQLLGLTVAERTKTLMHLAHLLMLAAGITAEENNDEC